MCCAQWSEPDSILSYASSVMLLTGFHSRDYVCWYIFFRCTFKYNCAFPLKVITFHCSKSGQHLLHLHCCCKAVKNLDWFMDFTVYLNAYHLWWWQGGVLLFVNWVNVLHRFLSCGDCYLLKVICIKSFMFAFALQISSLAVCIYRNITFILPYFMRSK